MNDAVRRGVLVWLVIIAAETLHGIVRGFFITPIVGELRASQIGVLIGSVLIFFISLLTVRWINGSTNQLIAIGVIWVGLTAIFEIGLGAAIGLSCERIFSDYDIRAGGMMLFGLLFMLVAPYLSARLRSVV